MFFMTGQSTFCTKQHLMTIYLRASFTAEPAFVWNPLYMINVCLYVIVDYYAFRNDCGNTLGVTASIDSNIS